jgi:hypothetical protein
VLDRPEAIDGTRRLLSEITRSPVLTRMLCQREPRSTVSDWVRPGRVTIISGEAGEVGESAARYLLSVLLALSWAELLSGPGGSKTVLALDEAQWYAHESVSEVLRMGRDRNVHLWLATQALASLPDGVREAAQTNAADFVIYRGSPEEAREFHRWAPVVREETLLSLPRGRAVLLRGKSESISWVTIDPCAPARSVEDALRLATESSRPSWVPEEGEASEGPDARPGESGAPAAPDAGEAEKLRPILLVIWAGLLDADPAARIEVPVGPLRQELDPTGAVVRRVGAELARVGALSGNRREPDGRVWVVERVGIPELLGGGVGAEELALATTRWRQIARSARGAAR